MRRKITGGSDAASQEAFLKPVCWLRSIPLRGKKEDPHGQKTLSAERWKEQKISYKMQVVSCKNKKTVVAGH